MAGRPFVYGVAAMGERGAAAAMDILADEVDRTLALLGLRNVAMLDRSALFVDDSLQRSTSTMIAAATARSTAISV